MREGVRRGEGYEAAGRVRAGFGTKARRVEPNFIPTQPSLTRLTNLPNSGPSESMCQSFITCLVHH